MDPPPPLSPSKMAFSPGMPLFPVSPERAAGTKPLYGSSGSPLMSPSPSTPNLRSHSPLRNTHHRRNDSDVSVHALAGMFENLEVKDPREANKRFREVLEKERTRNIEKLAKLEKEYAKKAREHDMALGRRDVRIDELKSELEHATGSLEAGITKERYEKERKASKAAIAQWETVFKQNEERWKSMHHKLTEAESHSKAYEGKYRSYKKQWMDANNEKLRHSSMIPQLQTKIQGLQRSLQRAESDARFKGEEASQYKNQVYGLQVEIESVSSRLGDELQTLQDRLRLVEGERDALKASLQEEEVMRIAAEGYIPLPTAATEEDEDEFGSPIRSPRKPRNLLREDDDKENVSPKKGAVDLRFLHQELAIEKRLRERAQDQIDFMKMECQFQCCSCRIAENRGKQYVHDDEFDSQMERIKRSIPVLTPPQSSHGDDIIDVVIKKEPVEDERPLTPPETGSDNTVLLHQPVSGSDTVVAFSPSTGTFRSIPSPAKTNISADYFAPIPSSLVEMKTETSPWAPDALSTIIPAEEVSLPDSRPASRVESIRSSRKENKSVDISIHEDVIEDSEDEDMEPPTPTHEPTGPATPYLTRTITTTTTIPLHFSPATPAFKVGRGLMTPSTVAHAAADARTPILGELSLNKLGFDREAALQAIRERRGRARSMAAGHGTPMGKQMMEGVKDRRDISAPVSRVRG
ncbi:hypothetical protein EJ02DRAFT_382770 [Clathrospora elynae]|uniref:Uncharacterized protein n=1 Tax=Clathrospora elynae TaxID=706981 RepID=A0A6A5SGY0_9PLEO|nr:hypothetical protein EJ02DRAFT_382770 [Clathrospora elynae]